MLLRQHVNFFEAVNTAVKEFDVEWWDVQEGLTARSAAKRRKAA
jgi:hypothetical protein